MPTSPVIVVLAEPISMLPSARARTAKPLARPRPKTGFGPQAGHPPVVVLVVLEVVVLEVDVELEVEVEVDSVEDVLLVEEVEVDWVEDVLLVVDVEVVVAGHWQVTLWVPLS